MKKKYTVFVSSTYEDLKEEREKVFKQILRVGLIPIGMEMFNAGNLEEWELIKRTIDEADYYLLIIGPRFGSSEKSSGLSYTQKEFYYAKSLALPRATFILSDEERLTHILYKSQSKKEKNALEEFINEVKNLDHRHCATWRNKDELATEVALSLSGLINDSPRPGWTRTGALLNIDGMTSFELLDLRKRINEQLLSYEGDINLAQEYYASFDNRMYHWMKKQTYIDMFQRVVKLNLLDQKNMEVNVVTRIDFINVKKGIEYYSSSPRFETKEEAVSYKTVLFSINQEDLTESVKSKVCSPDIENSFPYKVQNTYPLKYNESRVVLRHETRHIVPIDRFIQTYMLIFPCRTFRCDVVLENDYNKEYRLVAQPFSSFNVHTYPNYEPQIPINQGTITIPMWSLPGSGYEVVLQKKQP